MSFTSSCTPLSRGGHIPCWIGEQIDEGQTEEHLVRRRVKWFESCSVGDLGVQQNRNKYDRVAYESDGMLVHKCPRINR